MNEKLLLHFRTTPKGINTRKNPKELPKCAKEFAYIVASLVFNPENSPSQEKSSLELFADIVGQGLDQVHPKSRQSNLGGYFQHFINKFVLAMFDLGVRNPKLSKSKKDNLQRELTPLFKKILSFGIFCTKWPCFKTTLFQLSIYNPDEIVPFVLQKIQLGFQQSDFRKVELLNYLSCVIVFVMSEEKYFDNVLWIIPNLQNLLQTASLQQEIYNCVECLAQIYEFLLEVENFEEYSHIARIKDDLEEAAVSSFEEILRKSADFEFDASIFEILFRSSKFVWEKISEQVKDAFLSPSKKFNPKNLKKIIKAASAVDLELVEKILKDWTLKKILRKSKEKKSCEGLILGPVLKELGVDKIEYELAIENDDLLQEYLEIFSGFCNLSYKINKELFSLLSQVLTLCLELDNIEVIKKASDSIFSLIEPYYTKIHGNCSKARLRRSIKEQSRAFGPAFWIIPESQHPERTKLAFQSWVLGTFTACFKELENLGGAEVKGEQLRSTPDTTELYSQMVNLKQENEEEKKQAAVRRLVKAMNVLAGLIQQEMVASAFLVQKDFYLLFRKLRSRFYTVITKEKLYYNTRVRGCLATLNSTLSQCCHSIFFGNRQTTAFLNQNPGLSNYFEHIDAKNQLSIANQLIYNYIDLFRTYGGAEGLLPTSAVNDSLKNHQLLSKETGIFAEPENRLGFVFDTWTTEIFLKDGVFTTYLSSAPLLANFNPKPKAAMHETAAQLILNGFVLDGNKFMQPVLQNLLELLNLSIENDKNYDDLVETVLVVIEICLTNLAFETNEQRNLALQIIQIIGEKSNLTKNMPRLRKILVFLLKFSFLRKNEAELLDLDDLSSKVQSLPSKKEELVPSLVIIADILTSQPAYSQKKNFLNKSLLFLTKMETSDNMSVRIMHKSLTKLFFLLLLKTEQKTQTLLLDDPTFYSSNGICSSKQVFQLVDDLRSRIGFADSSKPGAELPVCLQKADKSWGLTKNSLGFFRVPVKLEKVEFEEEKIFGESDLEKAVESLSYHLQSMLEGLEESKQKEKRMKLAVGYDFLDLCIKYDSAHYANTYQSTKIEYGFIISQVRIFGTELLDRCDEIFEKLAQNFEKSKILKIRLIFTCCALYVAGGWFSAQNFETVLKNSFDFFAEFLSPKYKALQDLFVIRAQFSFQRFSFDGFAAAYKLANSYIENTKDSVYKISLFKLVSALLMGSQALLPDTTAALLKQSFTKESLELKGALTTISGVASFLILSSGLVSLNSEYKEKIDGDGVALDCQRREATLAAFAKAKNGEFDVGEKLEEILKWVLEESVSSRVKFCKVILPCLVYISINLDNLEIGHLLLKLVISIDPQEDESMKDACNSFLFFMVNVLPKISVSDGAREELVKRLEESYSQINTLGRKRNFFRLYAQLLRSFDKDRIEFLVVVMKESNNELSKEIMGILVGAFKQLGTRSYAPLMSSIEKRFKR